MFECSAAYPESFTNRGCDMLVSETAVVFWNAVYVVEVIAFVDGCVPTSSSLTVSIYVPRDVPPAPMFKVPVPTLSVLNSVRTWWTA